MADEKMSKVSYSADFSPTISRLFVFRFLTMYVEIFVMMGWMMWLAVNMFVHFWIMLFTGTRSQSIWNRQLRFIRHFAKWQAYLTFLVDTRPMWIED